jgi:hypothetical protein
MSLFSEKLLKSIFKASLALVILIGTFLYGTFAQIHNLQPIPFINFIYKTIFVDNTFENMLYQRHHLQHSRNHGEGVIINKVPDDEALIFMAGFFDEENQVRLIRRDGTLIRKWSLDYFEHFPNPANRPCDIISPLLTDIHGAHLTPQGEVVFNYEYCGSVKLDQCGGLIWKINKPTHHSIVPAEAGGYWLLSRYYWPASDSPDRFPPFSSPGTDHIMEEDTLLRVSENGEVLEEVSIPELMIKNNLEALLTANGTIFDMKTISRNELVHANKVAELPSLFADSYPLFGAGDLALSMRSLNLIMVLDPINKKVKWHQIGPWLRQHDPEFRPDGRISIFNNNVYQTAYIKGNAVLSTPFITNIIAIDPVNREIELMFGEKPGQEILSVIRGQHEILANDGMLITEFDAGRVLEVDAYGNIIWEYVNHYSDEFVGEVSNAALYPADYFRVDWTTCQ